MKTETTGISFMDVSISNGFWNNRQKINMETTIYAVYERFKETGRFDAMYFNWKEGDPNKPHIFWDSDIAKWLESVAYILAKKRDMGLEKIMDEAIELIQKHQDESGYFNIYFTVVEPDQRFKRRTDHELYCAGHLIEAAVAYYQVTGKDRFLNLMRKYADQIEKVFTIDHSAAFITCGHEEIELALVKLYHATNEKRYLALAKFFIDNRGKDSKYQYYKWANSRYAQDHLPVRQQSTAEGHAVRAVYLYSAMADLALEYEDEELFHACRRIFENIAHKRMYITGGIGSSASGETFTIDYDLPNLTAYTESCAAIGLVNFAYRMLYLDADSLYADIIERVLYNGFLSGISLDGKAFFYENPLEIHPELINSDVSVDSGKRRLPIIQRKEVFDCSCCPPNITRFIASMGSLLYTYNQKALYVHHYIPSKTTTNIDGIATEILQETNYPSDGHISLTVQGNSVDKIALRLPYWCSDYACSINGEIIDPSKALIEKGYLYIGLAPQKINTIDVVFDMKVQFIEASPNVQENSGRLALQRGPVIYCLEAVDNGGLLRDVRIDTKASYELITDKEFGVPIIQMTGFHRNPDHFTTNLYQPLSRELTSTDLKFIPYFGFANRGASEMVLWVLKQ